MEEIINVDLEPKMTPRRFLAEMIVLHDKAKAKAATGRDPEWLDFETLHWEMDDVLCKYLTSLGYGQGVELYNSITKWYA